MTRMVEVDVSDLTITNGHRVERRVRTANDLLDNPPETPPALTDPPLIVRGGITVLAAPTKVGKTNLILHHAWALTEGRRLWWFNAPQPARVLLIELELSEATMEQRLRILTDQLAWSREARERFTVWCGRSFTLDRKGGTDTLRRIIDQAPERPDLVWIDSYNAAIAGDPDKTGEARRGLAALRTVQDATDVAIGLTAELRKQPPGQKPRADIDDLKGSNDVAYDCDTLITMRPLDERRRELAIQFPALRHVAGEMPDNLKLLRRGLSFDLMEVKTPDHDDELLTFVRGFAKTFGAETLTMRAVRDQMARLEPPLKARNEAVLAAINTVRNEPQ